jgi:tellurite resistance protein TerC
VTTDRFLVFTSNIFAIMGLRSMFFLLGSAIDKFVYLKPALALVLLFVGVKMLLAGYIEVPTMISLGAVLGIFGVALLASLWREWREAARDQASR